MAGTGPLCCRASCQRNAGGKRVPDFGFRMGCRFRIGSQAEIASWNERSDWDALSGSAFKRKLRPGFWLQSGMPFPVEVSGGSCIPESSFRVGRAFRMGFKRKLCPRIDMASSGKRVLECRAGVFGGRGWKGEHCLHTRRRRGGDPHGGTWGVVVLRGVGLPLPKIHLVNQMLADRIKLTAAQVVKSWAAPLLGQEVNALMAATCYASNAA